jgi:hypothetical protein
MELNLWASTACDFLKLATDGEVIFLLDNLLSMRSPFSAKATMNDLYHAILQALFLGPADDARMGWQILLLQEKSPISLPPWFFLSYPIEVLVKIGCIVDDVGTEGFHTLTLHPSFESFVTDDPRCRTYPGFTATHPCSSSSHLRNLSLVLTIPLPFVY